MPIILVITDFLVIPVITVRVTGMIWISRITKMAGMTCMTRINRMTSIAEMTRIPGMTMLTGVTGMFVMKRIRRRNYMTRMTTAMR